MKRPHWRNWSLILASGFAVFTLLALGLVLSWRSADQSRLEEGRAENCERIEEHKMFHREESRFDLASTRAILVDLKIDPDSEQGGRLIEQSRQQAIENQVRFAPAEC